MQATNLLWIPLFPLLGAVFNLLFGGWLMRGLGPRLGREACHLVAIGSVAFSCFFTFSIVMQGPGLGFAELLRTSKPPTGSRPYVAQEVYSWIVSGETSVGFSLVLDRLSALMCMVVTGVGLLIHIFSVGYMAKDSGYHRYFAYLNLFMASMLILVLGKSMLVLFVGWEGVGLCSYLLIGFWFTDDAKASAGKKAFIANRVGDFGFILGMLAIYAVVGSLDFAAIEAECASGLGSRFVTSEVFGLSVATIATLLLFLGCTGKSAQIPLFVWLPDAMAGPTPVSALIHAATMVTAGVYLMVRMNFLFALAPITMGIIAVIGAVTALFAASIAISQNDIKKVLAYSTVSQLGFMVLAVGMGAWVAAIFHLITHAFFKACLFLGSGSVIEACHHEQDIRKMGQLREKMPVTRLTFLVSCLAIAGVPLFSGFFSKDEILLAAYTNQSIWSPGLNVVVYTLAVLAAGCTAFYMFRLYYLTFAAKFRGDQRTWEHVEEQPIMTLPLVVLAVFAAGVGFMGYPHAFAWHDRMHHMLGGWLQPIVSTSASYTGDGIFVGLRHASGGEPAWFVGEHGVTASAEYLFMGISVAVALGGILFARSLYRNGPSEAAAAWATRFGALYRISHAKYFVDEVYGFFIRGLRVVAAICYHAVDQLVVDGLAVGGTAGTVGVVGNLVRMWHNGNVRRYLLFVLVGTGAVLATVFLNPTVSQVGPSPLNDYDLGGLRPTLGAQPVKLKFFGFEGTFGPDAKPRPPRARQRTKVKPPQLPKALKPGEAAPKQAPRGGPR